jgi:hypothetical protein
MYWTKNFKNKTIELQLQFEPILPQFETSITLNEHVQFIAFNLLNVFAFEFTHTCKVDHAGGDLNIALFGFHFRMNWYDRRHWDYKLNRWV